MSTDGSGFHVLHSFAGGSGDGRFADAGLIAVGSTLFGTTQQGGDQNMGTVFAIGVPEPSSLALADLGLLGLFVYVWRRRTLRNGSNLAPLQTQVLSN